MNEKPLAFLSLVKLLEKAVGLKTGYALLEPFPCATLRDGSPQIVAIQNAGRIISRHIGLKDYVFVISVKTQEENVGGHIELDRRGHDVFIELSPEVCRHHDAVLATLSHELSHKFLHLNGIRNGTVQIEQEFLTDVAAVYLGLGKLMLNGCQCESVQTWARESGTTTETHSLQTGYISRECIAFVYLLVCAMRGIPSKVFLRGLCGPGREAVLKCEREYSAWFKSELRGPDGVSALVDRLGDAVLASQDKAASRHRSVRVLEARFCAARKCIDDSHRPLAEAKGCIDKLAETDQNPHLTYLKCLESREYVADCINRADHKLLSFSSQWLQIDRFVCLPHEILEKRLSEVVRCPLDGSPLRVPGDKPRLLVTCPSCNYKFLVNTTSEVAPMGQVENGKLGFGFWRQMKSAFRRRG